MMKGLFLCVFATFLLSAIEQAESNAYYDKILTHSRIRARQQGPNVCALQQVLGTKKKYFSTCKNWYQGAICGKKATILYECCPGYMKINGEAGCPAVAPIDNVYGTLGIVGATATQDYSDRSELRKEIEGVGSFTFFAPSNDAWQLLDSEVRDSLLSNVNIELLNALHYHMINKRMLTKDLKNGLSVTSMFNNQELVINHYPNGVVTVNCARIIHGNQIATNGVVHVIDRVVTAVGNTIEDFIDSEDELSSFREAGVAAEVLEQLGKSGHYTLFAPTNDAFEKLPKGVLDRIMGDKQAVKALVNYHILNTVQCSEAIMGGAALETLEGSSLQIGCDGDSLTVNGIKMVNRKDIVTTNGVIHLIDQVLIPDSAKQVLELAGSQQTTFTDLMAQMGLAASFRQDAEYTLLAPVNNAFSDETLKMDQRLLKLILQNHILKTKFVLNELYNGQTLETWGGKILRVFVYRTAVCIENSCMLRGSKEGRNGAIHMFSELIKPAEKSLYDLLSLDKRFSIFLNLIEYAGLKELLLQPGAWTWFIPTNDAFKGLSEEELEILKRDKVALQNILLYHLAPEVFIGGGFEQGVTNILKSLQGSKIMVKAINNTLSVNGVVSKEPDVMTTNGVFHVIDKLLFPADVSLGNEQLMTILNKIIKYFTIKFSRGSKFSEIPLTKYIKRIIIGEPIVTTVTRIIEIKPEIRVVGGETITKVIRGDPSITKITKVIEGEPEFKLIKEGETRVTKVIQGEPTITKITRVIEGEPDFKLIKEGETRVTKVIQGEPITRITKMIEGEPDFRLVKEGETRVTKVIQGEPTITKITRVIEGEPDFKLIKEGETRVTKVIQGEPTLTRITKVIEGEPDFRLVKEGETRVTKVIQGEPTITKITRVIEGEPDFKLIKEGETRVTKVIQGEPIITKLTRVVEGEPDFRLIKEGETRVTKVIQGGPEITYTRVSGGSETDEEMLKKLLEGEVTRVTKFIEGDSQILEDDELKMLLQGEPQVKKVQTGRRTQVRRKMRRSHQQS